MAERYELPEDDQRTILRNGVIQALKAVPMHFTSTVNIEGLSVVDLFSINTLLGGAIESQTVATLNNMRTIWDPNGRWVDYEFKRYAESFPDVRLENNDGDQPLIGIELKGWYLLAKEGEPSFRFCASANAMTVWDLIVVFPWTLSNIISGTPILKPPYIEQAKYVADERTEYWEGRPGAQLVEHPQTHPYPEAGTAYSDIVHDDNGGNFGRIARINGLLDEWVEKSMKLSLAGIDARWWLKFFKLFVERGNERTIQLRLGRLAQNIHQSEEWADEFFEHILRIRDM